MKSISKSYGVPGLRLGVLASSDTALIGRIRKDVSIWNINSFAEFYMQIFGKYESDYKAACHKFIAERRRFEALLKTLPYINVLPTQANFFCIQLIGKYTSAQLTKLLLARYNIMVKDCDTKNGLKDRNFIRISVRSRQDNDQLIAALRELLA
jgi:histidinol-phosphate/aromatic aminotransferase/cobyric acid decarboxylase-like protein